MTTKARWRAIVLVDADRSSAAAAAERHGCSTSSITKWRKMLADDPELAGHYAHETALAVNRYRSEFSATLGCALAKMRELIPKAGVEDMSVLLNIATHCGELLVQADALVPQKEPDASPPDRKRSEDREDSESDPRDSRH